MNIENEEQALNALINASSKQDIYAAALAFSRLRHDSKQADPETLSEIMIRLRTHTSANPAPEFTIPYSVRLIAGLVLTMGKGAYVMVDGKAWAELVSDSQTTQCMDPTSRADQLLAGYLGTMFGTDFYTDAYYHTEARILADKHMYVMSADGSKGYAVRLA